jgi:cytochrome b involved in lipid metabolism
MSTRYSWEEVGKHCEVGDCWLVIEDRVYDLS